MNTILNAIKCFNCHKILKSPILLPCGHSICKAHTEDVDEDQVECLKCGISHKNQEFVVVISLAEIIDSEIASFDFGPLHCDAKKSCENLCEVVHQIKQISKEPSYYAHLVIDELRNKVHLKSEELKLKIDENTKKLLDLLAEYQNSCELNTKEASFMATLDKLKNANDAAENQLNGWLESLNQMKLDETKWRSIKEECDRKVQKAQNELETFKEVILMHRQDEIESVVDSFMDTDIESILRPPAIHSFIIDEHLAKQLYLLCKIPCKTKCQLLYRASRDGFEAADFHLRCDNKEKTLTIIKTTNGHVFGGYTEARWNGHNNGNAYFSNDPNAYIFSLKNDYRRSFVLRVKDQFNSICRCAEYGPTFGGGHDIFIANNSNICEKSYSKISSYSPPLELIHEKHILAGSYYFKVKEIEVFQLK